MPGEIVQNPDPQPISVSTAWTPLLDRDTMSYFGNNKVTLTNWDAGTVLPEIAQGSAIDIDGSMARFLTDEAIGGAPADGVVYVKFIVATDVVTPELTAEAPTWFNTLGGWYNGSGERYSGHLMTKSGSSYTDKGRYRDESDGEQLIIEANRGIDTNNIDASTAVLGPTTVNGQITVNGEVQGTSLDINGPANISGTTTLAATTVNGQITVNGEVQGTSLDINGSGNISGSLLASAGVNTDNITLRTKNVDFTATANGSFSVAHGIPNGATVIKGLTLFNIYNGNYYPTQTDYYFNNTSLIGPSNAAANNASHRAVIFYEA